MTATGSLLKLCKAAEEFHLSLTLMMQVCDGEFLSHYHVYSVKREPGRLECKTVGDLIDMWLLSTYVIDEWLIVPLKHSVLTHERHLFQCLNCLLCLLTGG